MATFTTTHLSKLFSLFSAFDTLDLEGPRRIDLVKQFGQLLIDRTDILAVEFAITDDPDESDPSDDSKTVTVLEMPGGNARIANREESWWKGQFIKHRPGEHVSGVPGPDFGANGSLIVPLRFTSCFGAVRIIAAKSTLSEPDQWATAIFALTEAFSTRRQIAKRNERQSFYRELVELGARDPKNTFAKIGDLWQKLSRADSVWFWLHNEYTGHFELAAYRGQPPSPDFEPGLNSASAYAVDADQVVMINGDLSRWKRLHNGKVYQLQLSKFRDDWAKFKSLVCVPILTKIAGINADMSRSTSPNVCGAICLHYTDPFATAQQPKDSLRLMGRQSAQMIGNAFLEDQRHILVSLTRMAQKHLTRVTRRPVQARTEYLRELIELIQKSLGFRTVSLFYRRPLETAVECLASTGLATPDGVAIPPNRLFKVVYQSGEGRTGECFRTGNMHIKNPRLEDTNHSPRTLDIDPKTGEWVQGAVFQPITQQEKGNPSTNMIGVIRCGGFCNTSSDNLGGRITFQPVQIQTLGFIAQQVGPLLQIFENNIRRERTISTVKHDLSTNNNMIRDASERIARDREQGRSIREYDIKNLGVSHLMGANLIAQLDAEPGFKDTFNPIPTKLVGDILARVVNLLRHFAWTDREMKIEYDESIMEVIPTLKLDRTLIERVIHNLVVNAVKYGETGSTILITAWSSLEGGLGRTGSTSDPTDGYYLEIENEGIGIDDKDADAVGQPNYRADNAIGHAAGLGLGLYIARKAMERHGGSLTLINGRDPTIFSMFFPRRLAA